MREGRRIEVLCLAQDHVAQLPSQDVLGTRHPSPDVCCPLPPQGGMAGSRFPPVPRLPLASAPSDGFPVPSLSLRAGSTGLFVCLKKPTGFEQKC